MVERVALSASQIGTFEDCKRKWAFEKLDGLPRPQFKSAAEGTKIHAEVEAWINGGTEPESAPARALVQALKDRGVDREQSAIVSEVPFNFVWPDVEPPVWVRGYIDLMDLTDPTNPKVIDFKTVSAKSGFKRVDDVVHGPQGVIYPLGAKLVAQDYGLAEAEQVDMTWIYVVREDPKSRPPSTHTAPWTVDGSAIENGLQRIDPLVREMAELTVKKARALDVVGNTQACYKFGPCPYRESCPDFPKPKQEPPPMTLSDADLAALAALNSMPFAPAELPPEATETAPKPLFEPPSMPLLDALKPDLTVSVQVTPPDAQPNVTANDPPPPPVVETKPKRGRPKKAQPAEVPQPLVSEPRFGPGDQVVVTVPATDEGVITLRAATAEDLRPVTSESRLAPGFVIDNNEKLPSSGFGTAPAEDPIVTALKCRIIEANAKITSTSTLAEIREVNRVVYNLTEALDSIERAGGK